MASAAFVFREPEDLLQDQLSQARANNEVLKAQLMSTSLVNELTRVLQSCTDVESIENTVLLGIQEIVGFDRAILFSIDKPNFQLIPHAWVGLDDPPAKDLSISLGFAGGDITDAVFLNRHIIVDAPDKALDPFARILGAPSYVVVPLVSKALRRCFEVKECTATACPAHGGHNPYCWSISGSALKTHATSEDAKRRDCVNCACFKCEGVFWMDRAKRGGHVTSDDIATLSTIINVAAIIIQNHRMYGALEKANQDLHRTNERLSTVNHELQVAQSKINADLERARKIQLALLPQDLPTTTGIATAKHYTPATAVGGDYYDMFEIAAGVYGVVVADVSGHGIASALIMSMVKVLLKTYAANERSPQAALERINAMFLTEVKSDNFVTIFYGVLDTNLHTFCYTSAGHCPVLLLDKQSKTCTQIKADGLFLGVFQDMMLKQTVYPYTPSRTRVILYTDGLTEEMNQSEEMFDVSRLTHMSVATLDLPPAKALEEILAFQRTFCGAQGEPEDDITLLAIDF